MKRAVRCVGWAICFLAVQTAEAQLNLPLSVLVKSGDPVPGTSGETFQSFNNPVINASGQVAFMAFSSGDHRSIVSGPAGSLALKAHSGDTVPPGLGPFFWQNFQNPYILSDGKVGFGGFLQNAQGSNVRTGIYRGNGSNFEIYADNGPTPLPTPPGSTTQAGLTGVSGSGYAGVQGQLHDSVYNSSEDTAVWVGSPGSMSLLAATRVPISGTSLVPARLGSGAVNNSGTMAFYAQSESLLTAAGNTFRDEGIFVGNGAGLVTAMRAGQAAPGLGASALMTGANKRVSISDSGAVAFTAGFWNNNGPGPGTGAGVWTGQPGQLSLVARSGQLSPGTTGAFADFFTPMPMGADGSLAFTSRLSSGRVGVWSRDAVGVLRMIAAENSPVPNDLNGALFGSSILPMINDAGRCAVLATLRSVAGGPNIGTGLFCEDASGLIRVLRTGDTIAIGPGDVRTISYMSIAWAGDLDGLDSQRSPFNSQGQISLAAGFTNGTSAVLLVTVPAPATGMLLGLSVMGLWGRRRRLADPLSPACL